MALKKHLLIVAWALLSLGAAACKQESASTQGVECYPQEARRWLAREAGEPGGVVTPAAAATRVYIDASGSMTAYLTGSTPLERPFQDLVDTLPAMADVQAGQIRYQLFGEKLRDLPSGAAASLLSPATYSCSGCDNQQSRLDVALKDIAAAPANSVSFLVTDLWLKNSEVKTTGAVAYTQPLTQIFKSGRAISVYGINAPYRGRIEDLPINEGVAPARRQVVIAARRPLFLLVFGPKDQVAAVHRRMNRSPSKLIADGMVSGAIKHSLFTLEPETPAAAEAKPLDGGASPMLAPYAFLRARQGVRVQQFQLLRAEALRAAGPVAGPSWSGPKPAAISDGAVWVGPMTTRATAWRLKRDNDRCVADSDWRMEGTYAGGWRKPGPDGLPTFELRPDEAAALLGKGDYLIVGEVRRTSLAVPNPADEWMRQWGFASERETGVLARPPTPFPTLNLGEMARLMESAMAEAAEAKPNVVGGFVTAVRVK